MISSIRTYSIDFISCLCLVLAKLDLFLGLMPPPCCVILTLDRELALSLDALFAYLIGSFSSLNFKKTIKRNQEEKDTFRLLIDCKTFYQKDPSNLKKNLRRVLSKKRHSIPHFGQKKRGRLPSNNFH